MHNHPDAYIETNFVLSQTTLYQFIIGVCRFYKSPLPVNYFDYSDDVTIFSSYRVVNEIEANIIDKAIQILSNDPRLDVWQVAEILEVTPDTLRLLKIENLLQ